MHSLANYTYDDIRAAVLSFIKSHETGTYALDNHLLTFGRAGGFYTASYRLGCHHWTFSYAITEVGVGAVN